MGAGGARQALQAGANDLGGTLMDENISRAAGAAHGQRMDEDGFRAIVEPLGRPLEQRTTLYGRVERAPARKPAAGARKGRGPLRRRSVGGVVRTSPRPAGASTGPPPAISTCSGGADCDAGGVDDQGPWGEHPLLEPRHPVEEHA